MTLKINLNVQRTIEPPIAEAQSWIDNRTFPIEKPLMDLAQAVPSYPPAENLCAFLANQVRLSGTSKYAPIAGIPQLRSALATSMNKSHGGKINSENVLISAGCNQAYCLSILALAESGDEVMLPIPHYFNHAMWLRMLGVKIVPLSFRPDLYGIPDVNEAKNLINDKTRAIVLVTPNNPTGAIYSSSTIEAFYELASEHNTALVLDETYKDFSEQGPPHGLFQTSNWDDTFIQLYSFSKSYSLPGYRVGSIIAGKKIIQATTKIMDTLSICASRISQDAALYGLTHLDKWLEDKLKVIHARRETIRETFKNINLDYDLISCGAYFAYVKHPFDNLEAKSVAKMLAKKQNILCLPGTFFGENQESYLRFAFANASQTELSELGDRLIASH